MLFYNIKERGIRFQRRFARSAPDRRGWRPRQPVLLCCFCGASKAPPPTDLRAANANPRVLARKLISSQPRYALLRFPKFVARLRSPNFDRCHSFFLALPAPGGARKRPHFDTKKRNAFWRSVLLWRRGRDSNPRAISRKLISSPFGNLEVIER